MMVPKIGHIRLSELNIQINNVIESAFNNQSFWVVADVTNHTFRSNKNYHNFDLVEKDPTSNNIIAKVSGKAWGNGSKEIVDFEQVTGQKFSNNLNVLVRVKVVFHGVYGLSLDLISIDTSFTLGLLEQQRQRTLDKLIAENDFIQKIGDKYYTRNNQLKMSVVIQNIALLSSKTSAGAEDFKHTLENNSYGFVFSIDDYFTVVQGENNSEQFLEKLIDVYKSNKPYDAVIIIRGGGSQTDFLIFDNYSIGRAVAKFPIPIITGIGHQKNETIVDLMAHTQTKTPTKAAEFVLSHNKAFEDKLLSLQKTIVIKSQQIFSHRLPSLAQLNIAVVNKARDIIAMNKDTLVGVSVKILSKPKIILYNRINDIKNVVGNFKVFNSLYLKNQNGYLGHYVSVVKMMDPNNILKKGFAILKINDKIVSDPKGIEVGDDIDIILSNTKLKSTIKQKSKYNGTKIDI